MSDTGFKEPKDAGESVQILNAEMRTTLLKEFHEYWKKLKDETTSEASTASSLVQTSEAIAHTILNVQEFLKAGISENPFCTEMTNQDFNIYYQTDKQKYLASAVQYDVVMLYTHFAILVKMIYEQTLDNTVDAQIREQCQSHIENWLEPVAEFMKGFG